MLKSVLMVGIGSFVGGVARYTISLLMRGQTHNFPFATLIVNLLGCLLIGIFYGIAIRYPSISRNTLLLLTTGVCGGFTTFSTFANESLQLIQNNNFLGFAVYISLSLIMGILAVFCGYGLMK